MVVASADPPVIPCSSLWGLLWVVYCVVFTEVEVMCGGVLAPAACRWVYCGGWDCGCCCVALALLCVVASSADPPAVPFNSRCAVLWVARCVVFVKVAVCGRMVALIVCRWVCCGGWDCGCSCAALALLGMVITSADPPVVPFSSRWALPWVARCVVLVKVAVCGGMVTLFACRWVCCGGWDCGC